MFFAASPKVASKLRLVVVSAVFVSGLTSLLAPVHAPATTSLTPGAATTFAGSGSSTDSVGVGTAAGVAQPWGVSVVGGDAYVSTPGAIEKVDLSTATVSYLAGNGAAAAGCPVDSSTASQVTFPASVPMTTDGTYLYTAASCNASPTNVIVRRTSIATGATSTVVNTTSIPTIRSLAYGNGVLYAADATQAIVTVDPSTGSISTLTTDTGIGQFLSVAVDSGGVWAAGPDPCTSCIGLNRLDHIDPTTGTVTAIIDNALDAASGPLTTSMTTADGYVFTAGQGVIRRFSESDGSVAEVAGTNSTDHGYVDAVGTDAWFNTVKGLASDGTNLWVGDYTNNRLREISPGSPLPAAQPAAANQTVTMGMASLQTVAGNGTDATVDGDGLSASISDSHGIAVTGGNAYIATAGAIRRLNLTTDKLDTLAGTTSATTCPSDSSSGPSSLFAQPRDLATDGYYLYTNESCSTTYAVIRRISLATGATSTVTNTRNTSGSWAFNYLTFGADGYLYASGQHGLGGAAPSPASVYRVDPRTGQMSVFATDPDATSLAAITSDSSALWVVANIPCGNPCGPDTRIDRIDLQTGAITTLVSDPLYNTGSPGGPTDIAPDGSTLVSTGDYLYGGDRQTLRRYAKADGTWTQIAGATNQGGFVDSIGSAARLSGIYGLASDGHVLFIDDANNYRVRVAVPYTPPAANGGPVLPDENNLNNGSELATQCACADPVNTATGVLTETATDLVVPGRGVPLALSRFYSSEDAGKLGRFGYGWTDNYSSRVVVDPYAGSGSLASSPVVDVVQDSGAVVAFTRQSNGTYTAPSRVLATLRQNGDGSWTFVRRAQTTFTFSAAGALTGISDLNGYTTTLTYDGSAQLTTVTDPAGRTFTYAYGTNGLVSSVTDTAGRTVSYGYDTANQLTSVTDPSGAVTGYGYDSAHRLTTVTDARNHTTTTVYDADGRVTSQTDRANRTTTFAYSVPTGPESGTTTVTDPRGNITAYSYLDGELTSEARAVGTPQQATWTYTYDPVTNGDATVTDPLNHTWTYGYDTAGNQTSACDPLNHCTTATFNSFAEPLTVTDASNVTTTNVYDGNGNLQTTSTPDVQTSQTATQTYHYDDATHPGDVTSVTSPRGKTTLLSYDTYGQLTNKTDPVGDETTYSYTCTPAGPGCRSNIGWMYSSVAPRGNVSGANPADFTTSYTRDDDGRVLTVTDPRGKVTTTIYDGDGNVASVQDPDGNLTGYAYNNDNQLTVTTRADTTTVQTGYDSDGNMTSQTDGANKTTSYGYDVLNDLTSVTDPLNRTTTFGYDAAGRRTTLIDPASQTTTYGYDNANRLTSTSYSDGTTPNVTFGYDADNRRTAMTDGTGTSSYGYDSLGRLTSATDGAGHIVGYTYDLGGNLTALTYPNGHTVTRGYDDADRLASVTDWNTNTTSFGYDPNGNLTTTTSPNGVVESTTVNAADQVTAMTDTLGITTLATYSYGRDNNGQLTSTTPTGSTGQGNETYGYSALNQLTTDNTATNGTYSYDHADNLTGLPSGATQAFDDANQITSVTNSTPTTTYGYDSRGNRTSATNTTDTATYAYDQANRLTSITSQATGTLGSYTYDGDGLRSSKTTAAGTRSFSWDNSSSLPLLLSDSTNNYIYGPGGLLVEQLDSSGTPTYIQHDQQGSTRVLTDASGNVVGTYTYDPYGNVASETGAASTALRYNGEYQDDESGLYYLRARYYDPTTAQFLTRDPLEATTGQPYQYGSDDPLDLSDPTGLDVCVFGHCVSTPSLPSLQQVGDWAAGFGDTVTFGGTKQIRRLINYEQTGDTSDIGVDQCDDFYHWGNIGGDIAQFFDAPAGIASYLERKGLIKGSEIVFSKDFRVAPLGGSKPQGWQEWLPHYHRRIVDGAGNTVDGGGIGWHRPWQNGF